MKRTVLVTPSGDEISVTADQVEYLVSVGYKHKEVKASKSKVKEIKEDGDISGQ